MKTKTSTFSLASLCLAACVLSLSAATLRSADSASHTPTAGDAANTGAQNGHLVPPAAPKPPELNLKFLERGPLFGNGTNQVTWLGLATEEASDPLIAQLQLDPGVGLVVTYVAPDSPAAKAGLQKNDVLVKFDGQELVHPAQLRRLVQVRKEGDTVKLAYYRGGRKDSVSLTLGKTTERTDWSGGGGWENAPQQFRQFEKQFRNYGSDAVREQARNLQRLQQSLGDLHINQEQIQREVRRSVEQARKAAEDALRYSSNYAERLGPSAKMLQDLARGWVGVNKNATVTVNSSGNSARTMVKADDTGTYVIVANPQKRLTVHDRNGKLLFDGEIETPEQQAKVPKDIWEKVKPMVDKMNAAKERAPEPNSPPDL